jgi:CRISPR-associated endonuclease Csn1
MSKILGIDLGTNSIGWAIRETDVVDRKNYISDYRIYGASEENEIVDYGVVVFNKGVGESKSGEFSLAAERRANRSKRRLYNAKRYRKWELLKVLIQNDMCPLTMEELKLWSVGNFKEVDGVKKNIGRVYPIHNENFQKWLAFDPVYFGAKGVSDNGKIIRKNPYDLRYELLNEIEINEFTKKQKVGRALYQLIQRRGFKSNRKLGSSKYEKNEDIERIKAENFNFHIANLAKEKLDKGERFRASGVIQRKYFEEEFYAICEKQSLDISLIDKLYKAIYFVRPLRSQKGLIGKCTLEKGKFRIPISHPKFEEFRALSFINNIKWREHGSQSFEPIPISLKKQIFENLFFRKLEKGINKGKVNTDSFFKFDEIIKRFSENGKYEFNYKNKPNVSTCPIIASLMNVFENEWQNKFITDENRYGINWDELKIEYTVKYGNEKKIGKKRVLGIDEIWHLLFDFILTKDNKESLELFCKDVLGFEDSQYKLFASIDVPQGYGSLSYCAINKILPFLQNGYIYTEAVLFANLKKVLGSKFESSKEDAKSIIKNVIKEVEAEKEKLNIVNGLIKRYFSSNFNNNRAKGVDDKIKEVAYKETIDTINNYFGKEDWAKKPEDLRKKYENEVLTLYLKFLDGKQEKSEKASSELGKNPEIDYYRLPRLDEKIKEKLKLKFDLSDTALKKMYHPSDIEIYPKSKTDIKVRIDGFEKIVKQLESPQPPSKGWKNPMAMRTLHQLRHLINYLLRIGKIDIETKVVIEMARELNDANKRQAIQNYQRRREQENKEFAKAIIGVAKEKYPNLNENDIENINKVRLWWEQLENSEEVYNEIKSLKEDVQKYRLWKEQESLCMYTGKTISLTDLFDGTKTQIMHTFPLSKSFDSSLSNLTVGDAYYNKHIQGNLIPTKLPNYNKDCIINGKRYKAIEPGLNKWKEKLKKLKSSIDDNIQRTKKTQDPEAKKELIQNRHLLKFDYDYWEKKVATFTLNEIDSTWKNSQLVDTQIITKYARAYMKTVFNKVDVQKGEVVNIFKKIYGIKGDEQKDRSKHSHHAIDAATLTLIPGSAKREAILSEYFTAKENQKKYHEKPYDSFVPNHVLAIENNVLVNHIIRDKTLTATFKKIKKKGEKAHLMAQGDSIRGRLHEETFLGAIKPLERNEQGYPVKENGKYKTIIDSTTQKEEIWIVARKPVNEIKLEKGIIKDAIVDELLKQHLQSQINNGKNLNELTDFNNLPIRHIRMRVKTGVGYLSNNKAMPIKPHTYQSKHAHKRSYLAKNDENYLFLLYENKNNKGKTIKGYRILNLFDIAKLKINSINQIKKYPEFQTLTKGKDVLNLKCILKKGYKAIFYEKDRSEINRGNINSRMFKLLNFNEMGTPYLYFQNCIEARKDSEIEKKVEKFNPEKYQARLTLKINNLNCLFEMYDFIIKPDGEIVFI